MATIIDERPATRVVEDRTVYDGSDSSGWAVALIVLVVLALIALFAWPGLARRAASPISPSTIQVNVPGQGSGSGAAAPSAPAAPTTNSGASSGAQGSVSGSAAGSVQGQ